ncbi:hypothetical protein DPMN_031316 [Dreissena polymorpha]|uniref:Uncharacterized protein n=1 Tax=Dreissena polymorpha TaxID=45954 RepID=A0A9D4M240_DREPO|nr:hypothetical protein DPMN_031316 [Dreissena polymorpha]
MTIVRIDTRLCTCRVLYTTTSRFVTVSDGTARKHTPSTSAKNVRGAVVIYFIRDYWHGLTGI